MKKFLLNTIVIVVLLIIVASLNWRVRDKLYEIKHDIVYGNKEVLSKQEIDDVYDKLEKVTYKAIDEEYLTYTKSNGKQYSPLLRNQLYLKLNRENLNQMLVIDFRIKDFLCKDSYYQELVMNEADYVYGLLDKKLLYKTLELNEELEKGGYDAKAYVLVNGHRHPKYNEEVGGAKLSRHIKGQAVDIQIKDINFDGRITKEDKDIVLELLDKKVIGDEGGIGLYPGTDRVHYDVRGSRARWDTY